ncbi:MAG TPA: LuxR C-terminal-related transcriptional regulator [Tepidisphaeraceae bacterium]|jgi:DNA-binding CsgD family transcriptional regulator|nr:LuxR C-terminal-related transcriptional regulator [Tepidisphaeraceae bacterium]
MARPSTDITRTLAPREAQALSSRQLETLEMLLGGLSEKQVATAMELSVHTVHVYVKSLYVALGVNSRAELMALFLRYALAAERTTTPARSSTLAPRNTAPTVRPASPARARLRPDRRP